MGCHCQWQWAGQCHNIQQPYLGNGTRLRIGATIAQKFLFSQRSLPSNLRLLCTKLWNYFLSGLISSCVNKHEPVYFGYSVFDIIPADQVTANPRPNAVVALPWAGNPNLGGRSTCRWQVRKPKIFFLLGPKLESFKCHYA